MSDDKKPGFFSRVFGKRKGGCCHMVVEEIPDSEIESVNNTGCCCSSAPGKQSSKCCENVEQKD